MHRDIFSTSLWFWCLLQHGAIKSKELFQKTGWYKITNLKLQAPYFIWQLSPVTFHRHSAACVGNGADIFSTSLWFWCLLQHGAIKSKELFQKTGWYKIMNLKLQAPYFIWQLPPVTFHRHSAACVGNGAAWNFFFHGATGPTGLGKIPPNEWSARHRDLYLTTYNTHKRGRHVYPRRDSNLQSQQASGRRPNP